MATAQDRIQFQALFDQVFVYKGTFDMATAATGSGTGASNAVTVPGVALGDMVLGVSFSLTLNTGATTVNDITALTAYVSAANTVTIVVLNNDGAANDLPSGTYRLVIGRLGASYDI